MQIRYLRRNLGHIDNLFASYEKFPLTPRQQKYLMVLHSVYEQQEEMHRTHTKRYTFIDHFSWEAFNEGGYLLASVEKYKGRFGFYPAEVLADQIYCTRDNRKELKLLDIKLNAKSLGRPSAKAVKVHLSPGQRNPVEGKFGAGQKKIWTTECKSQTLPQVNHGLLR